MNRRREARCHLIESARKRVNEFSSGSASEWKRNGPPPPRAAPRFRQSRFNVSVGTPVSSPRYQEKRPPPSRNSGPRCSPNGPRISSPSAFTASWLWRDSVRERERERAGYLIPRAPATVTPFARLMTRGRSQLPAGPFFHTALSQPKWDINSRLNESTVSRIVPCVSPPPHRA